MYVDCISVQLEQVGFFDEMGKKKSKCYYFNWYNWELKG